MQINTEIRKRIKKICVNQCNLCNLCQKKRKRDVRVSKQTVATTGSHNIVLVDTGNTGHMDIFGANWNNEASTGGAIELWLNQG